MLCGESSHYSALVPFIHEDENNNTNTICVLFILGEGYKPKMAVVVVQKRISARIFGKGSNG